MLCAVSDVHITF